MSTILTPLSLWKNFDDSLPLDAVTVNEKEEDGIKFEYVKFEGRRAKSSRVSIAGIFAEGSNSLPSECIFIVPDSGETVDEELIKIFVRAGYSVFMVDYRGEAEGTSFHTVYPPEIDYANTARCGRYKNYVDDSADKTCWYEWVAVCRYAYKYIQERTNGRNIGVVGIRDGGEIVWKLITLVKFADRKSVV